MSKIDSITLEINTDVYLDKLERIKNLLAEIKQLHDEVFGNGGETYGTSSIKNI